MTTAALKIYWSTKIIDQLDKLLVAERITNKNYEGDASNAVSVNMFTPGDVPVKNYTKNTDLPTADIPTDTQTILLLNQQKAFDFFMDRIDITQCPVNVQQAYFQRAIYAIRDTIDQFILGQYVNVAAGNIWTPAAAVSASTVWAAFSNMQRLLTDAKVPLDNRFAVIDAWTKMLIGDEMEAKDSELGDRVTQNGSAGRYCDFDIFLSHNVPVTAEDMGGTSSNETVSNILCGHPDGITLAKQIPLDGPSSMKIFTPEKRFGTEVQGLTVYGARMCYLGAANGLIKVWR
jgi:hypothetical protein